MAQQEISHQLAIERVTPKNTLIQLILLAKIRVLGTIPPAWRQALSAGFSRLKIFFSPFFNVIQQQTARYRQALKWLGGKLWAYSRPALDKLAQALLALIAIASTFKFSIQVAPIVLSIITVLATVPLFSYVLPQFLFAPSFLAPSLVMISCFAGYHKYRELVLRAQVYDAVEKNQCALKKLEETVLALTLRHEQLENEIMLGVDELERSFEPALPESQPENQEDEAHEDEAAALVSPRWDSVQRWLR